MYDTSNHVEVLLGIVENRNEEIEMLETQLARVIAERRELEKNNKFLTERLVDKGYRLAALEWLLDRVAYLHGDEWDGDDYTMGADLRLTFDFGSEVQ